MSRGSTRCLWQSPAAIPTTSPLSCLLYTSLEKLIQFLSENIGNLFSAKNISDYLKSQHTTISVNQIQSYTEYLNNAFLIHRVERYDLIGKRVFEIGEKYYFENMGIRNIVVGYRITDKAKILENLVDVYKRQTVTWACPFFKDTSCCL